MGIESVDIYVQNDHPYGDPVAGVVVRVFDSTGTTFVTSANTDTMGLAALSLPSGVSYQVRMYKDKFSVKQPQLLPVQPAPLLNSFTVTGHMYEPPEAVNTRMCRCSGFFRNLDNSPAREHSVHVIAKFDPLLVDGNAHLTELLLQRTDDTGYVEFDLVRNGQYNVTIEGLEDQQRVITIPDAPSANLPDLLFAVVSSVEFSPPGPWTLGVDESMLLTVTVHTSDGRVLPGIAQQDLIWTTDNNAAAFVCYAGNQLEIRSQGVGSANLLATRRDTSIVRIPNTPVLGVPVGITVA